MSVRSPTERTRNYASILYPESAPEHWEDILRSLHVTACVSPLHTGEKENGEELKPHFHIVLMYDSMKTLNQAAADFKIFGALEHCQAVRAIRGYLRYLCHLDEDPKVKEHYDPYAVHVFGDFDYLSAINSTEDDLNILVDITNYIHANHVTNLIEFQCMNVCHNMDWFRVIARSSTMYVKEIIKAEYLLELRATTTSPK